MFLRWIELQKEINQKIDGETRLPSRSFQLGGVTEFGLGGKSPLCWQKDIKKMETQNRTFKIIYNFFLIISKSK